MRRTEWWIYGVVPLAVLHLALFITLQSRPGRAALVLWTWGPPSIVIAAALLLASALVAALRNRHTWSARRVAALAGLCALVVSMGAYRTYPSSHDDVPSTVGFRIPLDGRVRVAWGGPHPRVNYHVSAPAQRWAYDLLITVDGLSYRGEGRMLSDYFVYGRPVSAPAAGRVIAVYDGHPDSAPGRPDPVRGAGNCVVLEVAPMQYLVVAHLQAGTIRVRSGYFVDKGDVLGSTGNSGNTSEPHVHLHLQDTPEPGAGEGIPFYFSNYVLEDGTAVARGMPEGGVRRGRYIGQIVTAN
jgi:murein DD-endopeptidase MepM/ murein hydrolase activator NlpD